jgi:3-oxoacyl-[acyl-carrier-protein] synthase III
MGAALPDAALSTEDLIALMAARFGFARGRAAQGVADRMAIQSRHFCRPFEARVEQPRDDQSNPDLAARAVRAALDEAGLVIGDIGYLIGHTTTPAQPLPSNIALVADHLNYGGPHIELRQACTGFANALMIAFGLIAAGGKPVAIVGSETGSLFFDPADMADDSGQLVNMVQMGDGAGAIIVGPPRDGVASIEAAWFGAIGVGRKPGISRQHRAHRFDHDFAEIRATGHLLFEAGRLASARQGCVLEHADWIIPHQVSGQIGSQLAAHFALLPERVFVNADRIGNTGSAAIWLALGALRAGRIAAGERAVVLGAEASKYMYGGLIYRHA